MSLANIYKVQYFLKTAMPRYLVVINHLVVTVIRFIKYNGLMESFTSCSPKESAPASVTISRCHLTSGFLLGCEAGSYRADFGFAAMTKLFGSSHCPA